MSDFNSKLGNIFIPSIMQFDEVPINDNDNVFIAFCSQNELWINKYILLP